MTNKNAYSVISKHIFLASNAFSTEYAPFVILANDSEEALKIAMRSMNTNNQRAVCLEKLSATGDMQVFTIEHI